VCSLPGTTYATDGAIVSCDACGKYWRYGSSVRYLKITCWYPLTRLGTWWIKRRTGATL
jgi:hypothetical protein